MSQKSVNPRCFIDFKQGNESLGRIIIELFADIVPRTAINFISLCKGSESNITLNNHKKRLYYKNSIVHRVINGFMIQMGDFTRGDGTGGVSIYGKYFDDENFKIKHNKYYLSMANAGVNTNGSQFFICTSNCDHLNGKHVVFGKIIDGKNVVEKIESVETNSKDKPLIPIIISKCGQLMLVKKNEIITKKKQNEYDQNINKNQHLNEHSNDSEIDVDYDNYNDEYMVDKKKSKKTEFTMNSVNFVDQFGTTRKGRGNFRYFNAQSQSQSQSQSQFGGNERRDGVNRRYRRDRIDGRDRRDRRERERERERIYDNDNKNGKIQFVFKEEFVSIDNDTNSVSSLISICGIQQKDKNKHSVSRSRSRSRSRSSHRE